jgi:hypothetical protein
MKLTPYYKLDCFRASEKNYSQMSNDLTYQRSEQTDSKKVL